MKSPHTRRKIQDGRHVRWWTCLLLAAGLAAGLAANARADWAPPVKEPPTGAELALIEGRSHALAIRILNLTPYPITSEDMPQLPLYTDTDRCTDKSFLFAPLGIPKQIPALQGSWSQDPGSHDWTFTPGDTNGSAHPYNFLAAWADGDGQVTSSNFTLVVKSVYPVGHGTELKDVKLRLYFTRIEPDETMASEVFRYLADFTVALVDIIGVVIDPENPIAWIDAFVALTELKDGTLELINSEDNGGEKMYFGAYTVPEGTGPNDPDCEGCAPGFITHSTSGEMTDGVDVQWLSTTGTYSSNLVVTTQVLRGTEPPGTGSRGFQGSVPMVMVTVWDPGEYRWARAKAAATRSSEAVGQRLDAAMGTRNLGKYTQFQYVFKSLNPAQERTFRSAVWKLYRGVRLTRQEEVLLEKFAAAMEKGQVKLSPDDRKLPSGDPKSARKGD